MRKFKWILAFAVVLALFAAAPAQAVVQDFQAYVYKWDGKVNGDGTMALTRITSGITFKVLAVDSDTSETLYYPRGTTSLTNPVTTANFESATVCNDRVAFRCDPTDVTNDRYVDLIVVDTVGGYTAFVENFDRYQRTIVIDERPNVRHHGMIWFSASSAVETDTGIDFLADTLVDDVRVEVVTVDSGMTLNVGLLSTGTGGDADGFRVGVSMATAGFIADTGIITRGTSTDYTAVSTYGALLYTALTGTNAYGPYSSTATLYQGGRSYLGHVVTGSNTGALTYTGSSGSDTAAGYIHYFFTRLR